MYNGYVNYETWCVCLWIDNDCASQSYWADRAQEILKDTDSRQEAIYQLGRELQELHEEERTALIGVYGDLLMHALAQVEWAEVAENCMADIDTEGDAA